MPLLGAKPTQIPEEHEVGCECVRCEATSNLTLSDWEYIEFYDLVKDQMVNITPMGDSHGQCLLVLRLEALESACRLYRVPEELQIEMVEITRQLFDAIQGRSRDDVREALSTPASSLSELPPPGDV